MRQSLHAIPALRIFHGDQCLGQLGRELERLGSRRAVIFCGSTLAARGSPLDHVKTAIGDRCAGVFSGVRPDSPLATVEAGAEALHRFDADAVMAVGGGSAIVTARASGILYAEKRDIRQLCTARSADGKMTSPKLLAPKLPQVVLPTTPTTAMSKAGSAVLDESTRTRLALFDPKTRAQSIFLSAELVASAPAELFAGAGLNTWTGALEGLMSRAGDPLSDALLTHAARLLTRHFTDRSRHDDPAVRSDLMFAALMCGQGTDHTAGGMTAALGHAIGSRCGIDHGRVKAIVLPHVIRFNTGATGFGLDRVATALDAPSGGSGEKPERVIDAVLAVTGALGLPHRLRDAGMPQHEIKPAAASAMGDWFLQGNPRRVTDAAQLEELIEAAW